MQVTRLHNPNVTVHTLSVEHSATQASLHAKQTNNEKQVQSTLSYATTFGARQSGRLRKVVAYQKNQQNESKTESINQLQKYTTCLFFL